MNIVRLNTVALDNAIIKKGSGGGGVTINNQSKSVEFTENGTSEVRYDAGYTGLEKVSVKVAIPTEEKEIEITENGTTEVVADNGFLSKVVVNTNVQSGGGGGSNAVTPKRDGRTHLYIQIEETTVKKDIRLPFYDLSGNSLVDWGDGTEPMQVSNDISGIISHTYASGGYYEVIIYGSDTLQCYSLSSTASDAYYRAAIYAIEMGSNVQEIYVAEYPCLKDLYIINSNSAYVRSLPNIRDNHIMMEGIVSLKSIYGMPALTYFKPVISIKSFASRCFDSLLSLYCLDFSDFKEIPVAEGRLLNNVTWGRIKIVVPDNLYDEWINATNWSSDATRIIKKSDWDAQNS